MYASDRDGTLLYLGPRRYVEMHDWPEPVVEVEATEVTRDDPAGTHWGWLDHDAAPDAAPEMIWPTRPQFDMCFHYEPEAEEKAGKGRIVRLAVRATEGEQR